MTASRRLIRHWREATPGQLARALADARSCVAAFAAATGADGSLLQSWVRGRQVTAFEHYPANDVVDPRTGCQFYYHSHRDGDSEHGHLHLFWHATASGRRRYLRPGRAHWSRTAPTHLFAISLDARGLPVGLFMVNRWVTDGHWFDAATTMSFVDRFKMSELAPYGHSCVWLTGFVRLYRPLIEQLLIERDRRLSRCKRPQVLDDRRVEVLSAQLIDWAADLDVLEAEAARRQP